MAWIFSSVLSLDSLSSQGDCLGNVCENVKGNNTHLNCSNPYQWLLQWYLCMCVEEFTVCSQKAGRARVSSMNSGCSPGHNIATVTDSWEEVLEEHHGPLTAHFCLTALRDTSKKNLCPLSSRKPCSSLGNSERSETKTGYFNHSPQKREKAYNLNLHFTFSTLAQMY